MRNNLFSTKSLLSTVILFLILTIPLKAIPWLQSDAQSETNRIQMFNTMNLNADVFTGNFGIEKNTSIFAFLDVCFTEDFADIINGDNTTTNGSGTAWTGNANFPTVEKAYQAGGAVKLGTGSLSGFIESKDLDDVEGNITVNIMVKGWTNIEGDLKVSIDGQDQILTYTATRTGDFEEVTATFTGVAAGSKLKIETTAKRAFIDNVEVMCEEDTTPDLEYCIPEGTNSARYINNFTTTGGVQNISNLATGFSPGGYGDFFDTHTVEQIGGETVNFSATFVGGTFGFRIWVDWNQDGEFDVTEEVAFHSTSYLSTHTGSFDVPTDAMLGTTRMRIVNNWGNSQGNTLPCATGYTNGEFEDYKFVVTPMADCAGTPEAGTVTVAPASGNPGATYTVSSTGYTVGNGMSYQWQSNTDGAGWVDEGTATANYSNYSATAPTVLGVEVEWRLKVTCTYSTESAFSNTATFTTALTYCDAIITSTVEPITRVIFSDIDNSSPVNSTEGYEDFTSVEGNVELGETYDIALEGFTGGNYTNAFTVWIDWDQSGTFEGTEMYPIGTIINSTGTDGKQALGTIMVPADAAEGSTRMRVIKNFSSSPTNPCGSYTWGQIEDYTIIVDGGVVEPEGCLDAPNGQYPSATFTPSCIGAPEEITDLGWPGEFSKVNVIAATEYAFSSSTSTDYVTISNEAGTEVYAAGVSPLVWTATSNEVVRFYIHLDDECNVNTGLRSRLVQCGEPVIIEEPDFDCFQGDGITSSFDNSYNINASNAFRTADDFTVEPGIEFTLRQITIDVNQQNVPNNAVINIREDNAGTPGAILDVVTMAPTSSVAYGEAFGDPIHHLTFDLATPLVYTEGTYWIEPKMSTASNETVWWLATSTGTNGAIAQRSSDDGVTWAPDANGLQMVFFVAGDCDAVAADGCDWTVTVSSDSTFGDEVTWELRAADSTVLLSGGPYSDLPYSDTQTVNAQGPLEFFISSEGLFNDNTPVYSVSNENGVIVSGILPGGSTATFSDLNCSDTPPPPPSYTCEDQTVPSNNFENGLFFGGNDNQSLAVDVVVGDNGFTVYGVELNIFTDGVTDLNFSFVFYDDAGGLPGAQTSTVNGSVLESELIGNAFDFDVYKYTVAFDTPVTFAANSTYWMEVETDGFAWEARTGTTIGSGLVFANNSTGGEWVDGSPDELVYTMICEELGVSDMNSFEFSYFPNPVKDVLNIKTQKAVKLVEAFNLTGQKVVSSTKVLNGQINVNSLTTGTYVFRVTLEDGQVETFKIIKK